MRITTVALILVTSTALLAPRTHTRCSLRASVDERDASGETPLIKSAEAGDCTAVRDLLKRGADPLAESYTQWTALHGAAECGCVECCRLLLDAGGAALRARVGAGLAQLALLRCPPPRRRCVVHRLEIGCQGSQSNRFGCFGEQKEGGASSLFVRWNI